jgi:hypothetical protein
VRHSISRRSVRGRYHEGDTSVEEFGWFNHHDLHPTESCEVPCEGGYWICREQVLRWLQLFPVTQFVKEDGDTDCLRLEFPTD